MPRDKIAFILQALREMDKTKAPLESAELRGLTGILDSLWSELNEDKDNDSR